MPLLVGRLVWYNFISVGICQRAMGKIQSDLLPCFFLVTVMSPFETFFFIFWKTNGAIKVNYGTRPGKCDFSAFTGKSDGINAHR